MIVVFVGTKELNSRIWKKKLSTLGHQVYEFELEQPGSSHWSGLNLIELGKRLRQLKQSIPVFVHTKSLISWARNDFDLPLQSEECEHPLDSIEHCYTRNTWLLPDTPTTAFQDLLVYTITCMKYQQEDIQTSLFFGLDTLPDTRLKQWKPVVDETKGIPWAIHVNEKREVQVFFIDKEKRWTKTFPLKQAELYVYPPLQIEEQSLQQDVPGCKVSDTFSTPKLLNYGNLFEEQPCDKITLPWENVSSLLKWQNKHTSYKLFWINGSTAEQKVCIENNLRIGVDCHNQMKAPLHGWYKAAALSIHFTRSGLQTITVHYLDTNETKTWPGNQLKKWWHEWTSDPVDIVLTCFPASVSSIAMLTLILQSEYPSEQPYRIIQWPQVHWNLWDERREHSAKAVAEWTLSAAFNSPTEYIHDYEIHMNSSAVTDASVYRVEKLAMIAKRDNICENIIGLGQLIGSVSFADLEKLGTIEMIRSVWFTGPVKQEYAFPAIVMDNQEMKGGTIQKPEENKSLLVQSVVDVDFKSAYPTIIINNNFSPERWNGKEFHESKQLGAIAQLVDCLVQTRAKETSPSQQRALKLIANQIFGFLGRYFRFLGDSITRVCRENISFVKMILETEMVGSEVIIVSTDGLLLKLGNHSKKEVEDILHLNLFVPFEVSQEYETVLINNANSYSYLSDNGKKITCKGMACQSCTQPLFLRNLEHEITKSILLKTTLHTNTTTVEDIWQNALKKLDNCEPRDLVYLHRIDESSKSYIDTYVAQHLWDPYNAKINAVELYRVKDKVTGTEAECIWCKIPVGYTISMPLYLEKHVWPVLNRVTKSTKRQYAFLDPSTEESRKLIKKLE